VNIAKNDYICSRIGFNHPFHDILKSEAKLTEKESPRFFFVADAKTCYARLKANFLLRQFAIWNRKQRKEYK